MIQISVSPPFKHLPWELLTKTLATHKSLHQAALDSRILSSNSRLLNQCSSSASGGDIPISDDGWSGNESEEEDFRAEIRELAMRKNPQSTAMATPRAKRPAPLENNNNRFSHLSEASDSSITTTDSTSTTLLTPSSSVNSISPVRRLSSACSSPGDFPWGQSAPS